MKKNKLFWILTVVCVLNFAAHLYFYPSLPDIVPTHWGASGQVNGWGPKSTVLILAALPFAMLILFEVIRKIDPKHQNFEKFGKVWNLCVVLFTVMMAAFSWLSELAVFGKLPDSSNLVSILVCGGIGVLFIILGNFMPQIKQNYTFGCRTPWALNDEHNWQRTQRMGGYTFVVMGIVLLVLAFLGGLLGDIATLIVLLVAVFGFFFATVSSRMVGLIGSSNNPVSGMAIATLLVSTLLLKNTGNDGAMGMVTAISIGGIICVVAAIAGDISQDLKTGFLVGATPKKQQIGEILGVICSAIAIGSIMYLLNSAWGYGSAELPAPQAMLMKMVVEGVMLGNLPWNLVLIGVFLSLAMWILGIPVLAVAIGVYLPIHLSAPIMVGGLLRRYMESRNFADAAERTNCVQSGVLYSSGLIAGEGLIGILLAILAVMDLDLDMSKTINLGNVGGLVVFALLVATIYAACQKGRKSRP